jgi:hypothetical protein
MLPHDLSFLDYAFYAPLFQSPRPAGFRKYLYASMVRRHPVNSIQKLLIAKAARGLSLTMALAKMYDLAGIIGFLSDPATVPAPRRFLREDETTFWNQRTI